MLCRVELNPLAFNSCAFFIIQLNPSFAAGLGLADPSLVEVSTQKNEAADYKALYVMSQEQNKQLVESNQVCIGC